MELLGTHQKQTQTLHNTETQKIKNMELIYDAAANITHYSWKEVDEIEEVNSDALGK